MQLTDLSPTASPPPPPKPATAGEAGDVRGRRRWQHVTLFCGCVIWYAVAHAVAASTASGFAVRFNLGDEQPLLDALALLFLVVVGIAALRARDPGAGMLHTSLGLPKRVTWTEEWGIGAALGWGISAAGALLMLLARALHVQLWTAPRAFWLLGVSGAALAIGTLAKVLALYGYGFRHLVEAVGTARATLLMIAVVAAHSMLTPTAGRADGVRLLGSAAGALLLCLCWARTRAAWMGWGVWFGWAASTALLFGLPLGANLSYSALVDGRAVGHLWLTGGEYGPSAAISEVLLALAAVPLLMRLTDEFAWRYARKEILPAGIPVDVRAPAAHAAMEVPTSSAASLVQIQPLAPMREGTDVASD